MAVVFTLVVLAGVVGGWLLIRTGERHLAWSAAEALERDPRPPVVYLRAFIDESATRRARTRIGASVNVDVSSTEEELLRDVLLKVGPFIALGRPGESLPHLGANRLYVEDAAWRSVVSDLMDRAAALVIRIGSGEGLDWEIKQALTRVPPERLLFVVPREPDAYAAFKHRAERYLPQQLPWYPAPGRRAWFNRAEVQYQLLGFLHLSPARVGRLELLEFTYDHPSNKAIQREFERCLTGFIDGLSPGATQRGHGGEQAAPTPWVFQAPPTWPPPPPGWAPPPEWRPDPSWPPPPAGWQFWTLDRGLGPPGA